MGTIKSWNHVSGMLSCEMCWAGGELCDVTHDSIMPAWMKPWHDSIDDFDELVIMFESSGSYDSGVFSGPVEKCYPPEGDEDREVTEAWISKDGGRGEKISLAKVLSELQEHYESEIDAADVDWGPSDDDIAAAKADDEYDRRKDEGEPR